MPWTESHDLAHCDAEGFALTHEGASRSVGQAPGSERSCLPDGAGIGAEPELAR